MTIESPSHRRGSRSLRRSEGFGLLVQRAGGSNRLRYGVAQSLTRGEPMGDNIAVGVDAMLNALPYFAMVMDSGHEVLKANTWFIRESEQLEMLPDECPLACFPVVHRGAGPHPDCPLTESARARGRSSSA